MRERSAYHALGAIRYKMPFALNLSSKSVVGKTHWDKTIAIIYGCDVRRTWSKMTTNLSSSLQEMDEADAKMAPRPGEKLTEAEVAETGSVSIPLKSFLKNWRISSTKKQRIFVVFLYFTYALKIYSINVCRFRWLFMLTTAAPGDCVCASWRCYSTRSSRPARSEPTSGWLFGVRSMSRLPKTTRLCLTQGETLTLGSTEFSVLVKVKCCTRAHLVLDGHETWN